jgi:hypothetical protein
MHDADRQECRTDGYVGKGPGLCDTHSHVGVGSWKGCGLGRSGSPGTVPQDKGDKKYGGRIGDTPAPQHAWGWQEGLRLPCITEY